MKIKSFIFGSIVALFGCSDQEFTPQSYSAIDSNEDYSVSLAEVQVLTASISQATRATAEKEASVLSIIEDEEHDTLLYVYNNPEGGWTIYSSDRRVPAIVAENDKGSYEEAVKNEAMAEWIGYIAQDMKMIKKAKTSQLNFTKEEIDNNIRFWDLVSHPEKVITSIQTKAADALHAKPLIRGHYELFCTQMIREVSFSLDHLLETHWHQSSPFNAYCPYKSGSNQERSPAGCVAIAGAQMLYYLHNKLGYPQQAPSQATCVGDINNYTMWQGGFNSTIWDNIRASSSNAAPLIANVGMLVGTDYGNSGSSAQTVDLIDDVFSVYGIQCDWEDYDSDDVIASLYQRMPVLIRAKHTLTKGHAFIIDDFRQLCTTIISTYNWVYDMGQDENGNFTPVPLPEVESYDVVSHTDFEKQIRMNWGWGNNANDRSYFSPTDAWIVHVNGNEEHNYDRRRKMIINFRVNQQ